MEWLTTSTVLASLRDFDNHAAWSRFVDRFRLPIHRFAISIGMSETDAEDVAQETLAAFARAFRDGQYDREKGRLSQWLFGIAYRKSQDERRKSARRRIAPASSEIGRLSELAVSNEPEIAMSWDREWEQAIIEQCLDRVRREVEPITFQAFDLVVRAGRPPAEAAASLGIGIKLIYNAKHRILKRIRELRTELEEIN